MVCRLQSLRDKDVPAIQRKADSLEADCQHDSQKLEELQADYALLEHELQVWYLAHLFVHSLAQLSGYGSVETWQGVRTFLLGVQRQRAAVLSIWHAMWQYRLLQVHALQHHKQPHHLIKAAAPHDQLIANLGNSC